MANEVNGDDLAEKQIEQVNNVEDNVEENVSQHKISFQPTLPTILEESSSHDDIGPPTGRFEKLSRPKRYHLEETLSKYGHNFKGETVQRLQNLIREQRGNSATFPQKRGVENAVKKGSSKSQKIYEQLQAKLRKVAFDTLADKMVDKLPEMILSMKQQTVESLPNATKCLWETLYVTLTSRLGPPENEHEERMYQYICFGLTKFVETIIENVPNDQEEVDQWKATDRPHYSDEVELGRKALYEHKHVDVEHSP